MAEASANKATGKAAALPSGKGARSGGKSKRADAADARTSSSVTTTVTLRTERVEHPQGHPQRHGGTAEQAHHAQEPDAGDGITGATRDGEPESPEERDGEEDGPRTTVVTAMVHQEDGSPEVVVTLFQTLLRAVGHTRRFSFVYLQAKRVEVPLLQADPLPPREAAEEVVEAPPATSDSGKASSEDKFRSDEVDASENSTPASSENSPRQPQNDHEQVQEHAQEHDHDHDVKDSTADASHSVDAAGPDADGHSSMARKASNSKTRQSKAAQPRGRERRGRVGTRTSSKVATARDVTR